jgi:oligoribonuclease
MSERRIAWVDIETTGLDPHADLILAVGCQVTDEKLERLAEFEVVLHYPHERVLRIIHDNPAANAAKVLEMHTRSGLLERVAESSISEDLGRSMFLAFLSEWAPGLPYLAGSSVHFDRSFLDCRWNMSDRFHHRHLDVSVLRVLAELYAPDEVARFALPRPAHTPLRDIDGSQWAFAGWRRALFRREFWGAPA